MAMIWFHKVVLLVLGVIYFRYSNISTELCAMSNRIVVLQVIQLILLYHASYTHSILRACLVHTRELERKRLKEC